MSRESLDDSARKRFGRSSEHHLSWLCNREMGEAAVRQAMQETLNIQLSSVVTFCVNEVIEELCEPSNNVDFSEHVRLASDPNDELVVRSSKRSDVNRFSSLEVRDETHECIKSHVGHPPNYARCRAAPRGHPSYGEPFRSGHRREYLPHLARQPTMEGAAEPSSRTRGA